MPASEAVNITLLSAHSGVISIVVYGPDGRKVFEKQTNVPAGKAEAIVTIDYLEAGMYFLRLTDSLGRQLSGRFIKR